MDKNSICYVCRKYIFIHGPFCETKSTGVYTPQKYHCLVRIIFQGKMGKLPSREIPHISPTVWHFYFPNLPFGGSHVSSFPRG